MSIYTNDKRTSSVEEVSLEKPLTRKEIGELDRLLSSQKAFEKMVEQAVRGRRVERRRKTKSCSTD